MKTGEALRSSTLGLLLATGLGLCGCEQDGSLEDAGEAIDENIEAARDAARDARDDLEDAAEEVEEAAREAAEALRDR